MLIDDSPVNLEDALEHGIAGATIVHPWNRELCAARRRSSRPRTGRSSSGARAAARRRALTPPAATLLHVAERPRTTLRDQGAVPAVREDLRDQLPAIEPERHVTDWGRSERVEARRRPARSSTSSTSYWFRARSRASSTCPAHGGALLVSNHSGALPPDAAMIAKAIKEEHPRRARCTSPSSTSSRATRASAMLLPKIGGVPAHPANVHRLLCDEEQLVLVFPEGRKGTEKLYKDRYRLRRFGRGGFVEAAMRAGAPIVPVAVVGAEEAAPIFAQLSLLQRLTGLLYFPLTPTFPQLGPLGMLGYLPAKFTIRFLEPIPTDDLGDEPWEDQALVQTVAQDVRARIQEELYEMLGRARRRSGSDERRPRGAILITGLSTYWGGRARPGARGRPRDRGDHRHRPPATRLVELERTEFVRSATQHSLLRRIVARGARSTPSIDTRLIVDSIDRLARATRTRTT